MNYLKEYVNEKLQEDAISAGIGIAAGLGAAYLSTRKKGSVRYKVLSYLGLLEKYVEDLDKCSSLNKSERIKCVLSVKKKYVDIIRSKENLCDSLKDEKSNIFGSNIKKCKQYIQFVVIELEEEIYKLENNKQIQISPGILSF